MKKAFRENVWIQCEIKLMSRHARAVRFGYWVLTQTNMYKTCSHAHRCTWKVLRVTKRCLKFCFRMEESKNLLDALEKMLAMKTVAVEPSSEPGPSRKRPRETDQSNPSQKTAYWTICPKVNREHFCDNSYSSNPGYWHERVSSTECQRWNTWRK